MFDSINELLDTIFDEFRGLGITVFGIGLLVMAIMVAAGGEEGKRKFQSGFFWCCMGVVVFFLAKPIIKFIRETL